MVDLTSRMMMLQIVTWFYLSNWALLSNTYTLTKKNLACGYGSIPINTIFRGMNIHKSQLFWCSPGVQGFDTLPAEDVARRTYPDDGHGNLQETSPAVHRWQPSHGQLVQSFHWWQYFRLRIADESLILWQIYHPIKYWMSPWVNPDIKKIMNLVMW